MNQIANAPQNIIPRDLRAHLGNTRRVLETYDFVLLGQDMVQLLAELKKARPDVNEFYIWAEKYGPSLSDQAECLDLVSINKTLIIFLEMLAANQMDTRGILEMIKSLERKLNSQADAEDFTGLLKDFLQGLESFVAIIFETIGSRAKLPITIDGDAVRIGQNAQISFNRTLRIPEDGRDYPLPAGFGRLPICRVEDYADKVPSNWLREGGFFIPLYQKEALFLEFEGAKWRPNAVKVAVGRVNAVTGDEYDEKIRTHKQDYLVVPDQKWLDGINSGEGRVGQFVAMPLGKGYTIEAQVTDEEVHGGFQLVVFDSNEGRFPNEDPAETKRRHQRFERRQRPMIAGAAVFAAPVRTPLFMPSTDTDSEAGILYAGAHVGVVEMGIARGGNIQQEIIEDTYGSESWNEDYNGSITIHLVNSEVYQKITGQKPPPSPITAEEYEQNNIPWYDSYDENSLALMPGKIFQHVKSIASLEKIKGAFNQNEHETVSITPEQLRRIKTPTKAERVTEFIQRADDSLKSGFHSIALRESTCALDLLKGSTNNRNGYVKALQIRGESNLALGRYPDAEGDASDCLEWDDKNIPALSTRAQALLKMGEQKLAIDDANQILRSQPEHATGRRIVLEILLSSNLTRLVQNRNAVEFAMEPASSFCESMEIADAVAFLDCIETGVAHSDSSIETIIKALDFRTFYDARRADVRRFNPMVFKIFMRNYYAQIWAEDLAGVQNASKILMARLDSSSVLLKNRSIPTIQQAINLGLSPLTYKPSALLTMLWWEMDKFATAQKLISELFNIGRARFCVSSDLAPPDWIEIDSRICSSEAKEIDLFGNSFPEEGKLNLFSLLTPEQQEEVREKEVGLFNFPGSKQYFEAIENLKKSPVFAPALIAEMLNKHLSPGRANYKNLNLVSGSVQLPEALFTA